MTLGSVAHGAAFSKHFAAFSLSSGVPSSVSAAADGVASSDSELVVDVVLAAKDGWGMDVLGELCAALSLPGARAPSPSLPPGASVAEPAPDVTAFEVEIEIVEATSEALEEEEGEEGEEGEGEEMREDEEEGAGEAGGPPPPRRRRHYCLHPTELRVRRRHSAPIDGGDDVVGDSRACASSSSSSWQTWRASAASSSKTTPNGPNTAPAASPSTSEDVSSAPSPSSPSSGQRVEPPPPAAAAAADDNTKSSHRRKIKKDNRASTFAALLVREFGLDGLRRGAGVVDVAGGSGELSFELAVRWGVPCTIIDPRGQGVHLTSRHKRLLASRAANAAMIPAAWAAASPLARQLAREWGDYTPANAMHIKRWFNASLMDDPAVASLLRDCSVVVGLHPDQATGAIVDCGLVLKKPWAVVPCCVFPSLFPGRLAPGDGKPVRTTEALVEHLMGRAAEAEAEVEGGRAEEEEEEGSGGGSGGGGGGGGASGDSGDSGGGGGGDGDSCSSRALVVRARRCELPCEGASTAVWWCPPPSPPAGAAKGAEAGPLRGREDWPWPSPPPAAGGGGGAGPFQLPSKLASLHVQEVESSLE
jgi:hypothetical protein